MNVYHVYFEYLPMTLSKYLALHKEPLPENEVRILLGSLLEAVRDINERESFHGDIFPEFIYLEERGQRR
jgi:serine/threonine protein kinase